MSQPSLFDKVAHHLPPAAIEDLQRALGYFTQHQLPFTAESLRDRLTDATRAVLAMKEHKNALGGFVMQLAKKRAIKPDGFVEAQRDAARGRPIRRWRAA